MWCTGIYIGFIYITMQIPHPGRLRERYPPGILQAAQVAEEELEPEFDPQPYLDMPLTATMVDYVQWWRENVGDPDQIESDLLITLGARFYNIFQKSEFNITRRNARRAERVSTRTAKAAANGEVEEEPEEEEAPPKRTRARAAAGRPARAAKPAAAEEAPAPAKPGRPKGGRRPAAGAAAY